ncbi:MAG: 50S ribosomal protein L23 [Spirochaeta sp. LUC14_002_19_P3]|nr:MAG: 50S ribosomal protein L23 [Spirochaeta sp. LUC14_002_19_P3]
MDAREIILEPVVTEKSNLLREGDVKTYVFKVDRKANKIMVKQAVRQLYKVQPRHCRIINVHSKKRSNKIISRSSFRRGIGSTPAWKKAMVTLEKNQSIDAFEGV